MIADWVMQTDNSAKRIVRFILSCVCVSGEIRGILCRACNTGIGHLQDSPEILRSATTYLERVTT